jgi:hypothetical protein
MSKSEAQYRAKTLDQFCPKVQQVGSESGTVYKNSAPVRANSALTAPIVGFRKEPTLIFGRKNFSGSRFRIYDGSGASLGSCPYASAHGAKGRARCSMQTGSVRRKAIKNTGSATVYFQISPSLCVKIPDAGKCYGSSKGLCNQTIG